MPERRTAGIESRVREHKGVRQTRGRLQECDPSVKRVLARRADRVLSADGDRQTTETAGLVQHRRPKYV